MYNLPKMSNLSNAHSAPDQKPAFEANCSDWACFQMNQNWILTIVICVCVCSTHCVEYGTKIRLLVCPVSTKIWVYNLHCKYKEDIILKQII